MQYIIVMTLSGSIIMLVFLALELCARGRICAGQGYLMLKIATAFYLIPLVPLKALYRDLWVWLINRVPALVPERRQEAIYEKYVIFHTGELDIYNKKLVVMTAIAVVWSLVACTVLLYGIFRSLRELKRIESCSLETKNEYILQLLESYKKKYRIRRKVRVFECPIEMTPFTSGLIFPKIYLSVGESESDLDLSLMHEMIHIRRGDVLFKQLASLAKYIHWFNPLVYILRKRLEEICELACDEGVIGTADATKRKLYADLILQNARKAGTMQFAYGLSSKKKLEERIVHIMGKQKKWNKGLVGALIAVLVFVNSFTSLANPRIDHLEMELEAEEVEETFFFDSDFEFVPLGAEGETKYSVEVDTVLYPEQFVDQQGNIYEITLGEETREMSACIHSYEEGIAQRHRKNLNGGCVFEIYNGRRCTKCGYAEQGSLISSHNYGICPH